MKNILIIAGESSGDLHAAELIQSSLQQNSNLHFFGIGGDKMQAAGADIIIENKQLAVIGIIEVLTHFKIIKAAFRKIETILKNNPPDLLILVDYPGFNLRLAKIAKRYNIKMLYFISPQLWAWKQYRIKTIKKCIDKMAVIFPFEVDFYRKHQVNACYVGNSLIHDVKPSISKSLAYEQFNLDISRPIVALLPGSRQSELKNMFNTLLQAANIIKTEKPDVQFILPLASHFSPAQLQQKINSFGLDIKIFPNQLYNILQICDAAICVSGTVTLEVALMSVPFTIFYKLNRLSYFIGKSLIKVDAIGLCNVVAKKLMTKEFIQHDATPENLAHETLRLLNDENYRGQQLADFSNLRSAFLEYPAENIGMVVEKLIN